MNAIDDSANTFRYYGEKFLRKKNGKVSYSQIKNLQCYLKHLYGYIGDMPIEKVTTDDIDFILDELTKVNPNTNRPTSHQYLINVRNAASDVFELALDREVVHKNPARKCEISKYAPRSVRRALTDVEQKLIVKTSHRARIGALIMMLAGLRRGELIPLTWDDVDLDNLSICINKSVEEKKGNRFDIKSGTKNGKWGRLIKIPLDLAIQIQEAKKNSKSRYICCKCDGNMHTPTSWKQMWNSYINTIIKKNPEATNTGIGDITAHYLRHTYATLLYISGVDVITASELMGHSNIKTTLAIYTHLKETTVLKSVDKFDDYVTKTLF